MLVRFLSSEMFLKVTPFFISYLQHQKSLLISNECPFFQLYLWLFHKLYQVSVTIFSCISSWHRFYFVKLILYLRQLTNVIVTFRFVYHVQPIHLKYPTLISSTKPNIRQIEKCVLLWTNTTPLLFITVLFLNERLIINYFLKLVWFN